MRDTNLWLWVLSLARVLNTHDKREGAGAASEMRSIHTQFTRDSQVRKTRVHETQRFTELSGEEGTPR